MERVQAPAVTGLNQQNYRDIFNQIYDALVLFDMRTNQIADLNQRAREMFDCQREDIPGAVRRVLFGDPPYDKEKFLENLRQAAGGTPVQFEWKIKTPSGNAGWADVILKSGIRNNTFITAVFHDITALKEAENVLRAGESFRELAEHLLEGIFELDIQGRLVFCNSTGLKYFGITREDCERGLFAGDFVAPGDLFKGRLSARQVLRGERTRPLEYIALRKDGTQFPCKVYFWRVVKNGKLKGIRGCLIDNTIYKETEQTIRFLSQHDPLTGLFNRSYFELEMRKLDRSEHYPGFILLDVDGLKTVNHCHGHAFGDNLLKAVASVLRGNVDEDEVLARIDGDEFAILLRDTDPSAVQKKAKTIGECFRNPGSITDSVPVSISIGMAFSTVPFADIWELFREADSNLQRQKLLRSRSTRSGIIKVLKKTVQARDIDTGYHENRVTALVSETAARLNYPEARMSDLRLFAQFHDLGKIGVPDNILMKNGRLSGMERKVMEKHCQIGYRIAVSCRELAPISDWILKHHEWWNGEGYPLGIKGTEIPLECRILAIVDAFDAMINDRPYRKALSREKAIEELKKCAGTQFDPDLVGKFILTLEGFGELPAAENVLETAGEDPGFVLPRMLDLLETAKNIQLYDLSLADAVKGLIMDSSDREELKRYEIHVNKISKEIKKMKGLDSENCDTFDRIEQINHQLLKLEAQMIAVSGISRERALEIFKGDYSSLREELQKVTSNFIDKRIRKSAG